MSYIGNEPIVSATRTITEITATAGQTVFVANGGYTIGYIDVFVNGAQLQTSDFTALDGSSITLAQAAQVGDDVRLVAWGTFGVGSLDGSNLVNASVSTAKLADASVTPAKLSTGRPNWDSSGLFQFNSGYGSVATAYGCRAWVNFNGTGTVAIRASGNVSSITDSGTGIYTVNLTTAMPDANYSVVGTCGAGAGSSNLGVGINDLNVAPPATSVVYINTRRRDTNADTDSAYVCVSVFR